MKVIQYIAAFLLCLKCCSTFQYQTRFFVQKVDHFGYSNQDTFRQRYLFSDDHWNGKDGPIFFYTGNEGDISMFANNTGIMWEFAQEFGAIVVFAEHRYYGQSLPYGSKAYQNVTYLGYLTSEQALADYAVLIQHLKANFSSSSVIVFGGSYGAMLAAWMRMKYPHLVAGAISSSGPILQFTNLTPCNVYNQIVTKDFYKASPSCSQSIRRSWSIIRKLGKTDEGCNWLSKTFRLCQPLSPDSVDQLISWLSGTWSYLAMTDYPYPTNFLVPLPANPINATCQFLKNSSQPDHILIQNLMKAVSVFQNFTGNVQCFNLSNSGGTSLGENGWDFQSCTEMVMPMCSNGVDDMFEPSSWNLSAVTLGCKTKWGVTPEPFRSQIFYGGRNISAASNIIFSNGLLDPWSGGGVLKSLSDSLIALVMPDAAHHLDLRASNSKDPSSVIKARKVEKKFIKRWIRQ
ncbi:lysosomal Pro-X carboxypeptidase-like [Centruroides sculpturatus]|uniref:lysosomal Pro-X carboxypeptidase-like n=1 Tax=Centruroides sculpturatus TaxID=218467 RepID=UPI000C6CBBA5|nr:lysosomal Pro-X carboxypeptidase-like [Centruroides sculpturatus]